MVAGGNRKGPGLRRNHQHGPGGHDTRFNTTPARPRSGHHDYQAPLRTGNDVIYLAVQAHFGGQALNSTDPKKSRHHLIIDRNNVCNDHHSLRFSPQVNKMIYKK